MVLCYYFSKRVRATPGPGIGKKTRKEEKLGKRKGHAPFHFLPPP